MTQSRAPLIIAIVLLLLPVLYVGSYFALVVPGGTATGPPFPGGKTPIVFRFGCPYRFGGYASEVFFWPLEEIDRKVRPGAWGEP